MEERRRTNTLDEINRRWYERLSAVDAFSTDDLLEPPLALTLLKYHDHIVGQPVLDIGVGAGRTTLYLSRLTPEYVGIDYSDSMVNHCRARFPSTRFERCDMQDLSTFGSMMFRFVLISFAALDAIGHGPRQRTLREIARVLEPGGILAFSAHNRRCARVRGGPTLDRSRNPLTQAANVVRWVRRARNHVRMRAFEYEGADYALVNDPAHDFALLHYYISKDSQRRQLEANGFRLLEMYDHEGNPLAERSDDRGSPWIWYVARRSAFTRAL
ncbi:MAG TPA: class I SAM-dependent methyltransferase [Gemmatimonadaceae bacterium]|nr:class I SAM-dependent methyltransferase [Gemmatimonadaceae bacterium]